MSSKDHVEMDGEITSCGAGGHFQVLVRTEDGGTHTVIAKLAGKMRKNRIRIVLGDQVRVAVSPYDATRGLIVYRKK